MSVAALEAAPGEDGLQELVRCAVLELNSPGHFAAHTPTAGPRWRSDSVYVFAMDLPGGELFTRNPLRELSGSGAPELSPGSSGAFGGRDAVQVGDSFGETFQPCLAPEASTGLASPKLAFLKRVEIQGYPMLVGAGYHPSPLVRSDPTGGSPDKPTDQDPQGGPKASAGRGAKPLYWQVPTVLNPYLSRGTKEAEVASLAIEPLVEHNPKGEPVPALARQIPSLENGGVSPDRTRITWQLP